MVTITDKGKKYTFKDTYTGREFLNIPEDIKDKEMQFHLIALTSIEPKITFDQALDLDMHTITKLMKTYFPLGEE